MQHVKGAELQSLVGRCLSPAIEVVQKFRWGKCGMRWGFPASTPS
jgi:hypothetical protein